MRRSFLLLSLFALSALSAGLRASPSETDQQAIQEVITAQIAAFQQDDAEMAFSYASPGIRERFDDATEFLAMVKSGYAPVYRPKALRFLELVTAHGAPMQRVEVTDLRGQVQIAVYSMEKQLSGDWRINGCWLMPSADADAPPVI